MPGFYSLTQEEVDAVNQRAREDDIIEKGSDQVAVMNQFQIQHEPNYLHRNDEELIGRQVVSSPGDGPAIIYAVYFQHFVESQDELCAGRYVESIQSSSSSDLLHDLETVNSFVPPNTPVQETTPFDRQIHYVQNSPALLALQRQQTADLVTVVVGIEFGGRFRGRQDIPLPGFCRIDDVQISNSHQGAAPTYTPFPMAEGAVPIQCFSAKFVVPKRLRDMLKKVYGHGNAVIRLKHHFTRRLFQAPAYRQEIEIYINPDLGDVDPLTKREIKICQERPDSVRYWLFGRFFE